MKLDVDIPKWKIAKNRASARRLDVATDKILHNEISDYLEAEIISESNELYHNQVVMVDKDDGSKRVCIDFRTLNLITKPISWPIPNIEAITERIGTNRPNIFANLDFTKGFFQCLLDEESRKFTTFITSKGKYQFNRVAMGLSGASAYFQKEIAETVLRELLSTVCEQYLDDILIYGNGEDQFIENLNKVFERLEEYNITLNPKKCSFGSDNILFLGKKITSEGIEIDPEKKEKVINFPPPKLKGQLKSFIGLVNYFHSFVPNLSVELKPLQNLLVNYDKKMKNKPIIWNEEATKAFNKAKEIIFSSSTRYYLVPDSPIYLMTDASQYGIGAYLFQRRKDKKDYPIAYISKSLVGSQLNWSTIEKEAYAIIYAIKQFEYLLRGIHFTLLTDHANLTYISDSCSSKVIRWKLAIQDFSFDAKHIKGENNIVADFLSRIPAEQSFRNYIGKINNEKELVFRELNNRSETNQSNNKTNQIHFEQANAWVETLNALLPEHQYNQQQYEMIAKNHNSLVGHFGVEKTIRRLREQNKHWQYMRNHVRRFIHQCPVCQKTSEKNILTSTKPFTISNLAPMEELHLDFMGPMELPGKEVKFILVILDSFTRFIELFPIKECNAEAVAESLIQHMGRYGTPLAIKTDNGKEFVNAINSELAKYACFDKNLSLAYSKPENGIVERANKEVFRHLRAILYDVGMFDDWDKYLPFVQRIMNAATHSSLGVSPAQLLFGNSIDLDRGILLHEDISNEEREDESTSVQIESNENSGEVISNSDSDPNLSLNRNNEVNDLSDWMKHKLEMQAKILNLARRHQVNIDVTNTINRSNLSYIESASDFPINSYVLARYKNSMFNNRAPSKFQTGWKGPLRVINKQDDIYTLQNLVNNKEEKYHSSFLKKFEYDPIKTNPRLVANRDDQRFDVEAILRHKNKDKRSSSYEFFVKWEGYDDSNNQWVPYSNLRDNLVLHQYLRDHKLVSLIPKKFKN